MVQKEKKERAIALRLQGKSYTEIMKALNLPSKGTLSFWFKNIELTTDAKRKLEKNTQIAWKRGLHRFNEERTAKILEENKKITAGASLLIPQLSKQELLLIGSALYWGEGSVRESNSNFAHRISFSNSDPRMVRIFMRYLREILNINDEKIYPEIQLHPNIEEYKTRKFWSDITGLQENRFFIYRPISRASKFKRPKNFLPHGTLNIKVNKRQLFYEIKGYIQGIINNLA